MSNFDRWWRNIGSGIMPLDDDDMYSHAKRVSEAVWLSALAAGIGVDLAKPGSERCVRVWVDADGEIKVEDIPIEKIIKDPDPAPESSHQFFRKDVQCGNVILMDDFGLDAQIKVKEDMESYIPEEYRDCVTYIRDAVQGEDTLAWKYTPRKNKGEESEN